MHSVDLIKYSFQFLLLSLISPLFRLRVVWRKCSCGDFQADINKSRRGLLDSPSALPNVYLLLLVCCAVRLHWHRFPRPSTCGYSNSRDNEGLQTKSGMLLHWSHPLSSPRPASIPYPPHAPLTSPQHEQLSRAKDANKSSKKKDSSHSNSAQNQAPLGIHHGQQSSSPNHGTPTSSTTSVNDTRGKSPDNASQAGPYPPGQYYAPQGAGMAGQPVNNGGPATPTKQGQVAPSVIISPSAPVS